LPNGTEETTYGNYGGQWVAAIFREELWMLALVLTRLYLFLQKSDTETMEQQQSSPTTAHRHTETMGSEWNWCTIVARWTDVHGSHICLSFFSAKIRYGNYGTTTEQPNYGTSAYGNYGQWVKLMHNCCTMVYGQMCSNYFRCLFSFVQIRKLWICIGDRSAGHCRSRAGFLLKCCAVV
jgi:hypothetical protein